MKNLILYLAILLAIPTATFGQNNYTIGTPTGSNGGTGYPCPFANWYWGTRQQYLVTAAEMQAAGANAGFINEVAFNVLTLNAVPALQNYQVWIKTTSNTGSLTGWESGMGNQVYGPTTYTPVLGWNAFSFPDIFWNGSDNIVIEICSNNSGFIFNGNAGVEWTSGLAFNGSLTYRADNANNCGNTLTSNLSPTTRPIIRFGIEPPYPNNASVTGIESPTRVICSNSSNNVRVNITNPGTAALDSVTINWQVKRQGAPQPFPLNSTKFKGLILPNQTLSGITVGAFQGGFQNGDTLTVYTTLPNGVPDSASYDDTLITTFIQGHPGGTFTIGDTNSTASNPADFASFNHVVFFLDSIVGICDSLVFEVIDSTFTEQVEFPEVLGTSAQAPVVFRGINGVNSQARLRFTPSNPDSSFTIFLNNAEHFIFENMAIRNSGANVTPSPYGTVILGENASGLRLKNILIQGAIGFTSPSEEIGLVSLSNSSNIKIENSTLNDGSIGLTAKNGNLIEVIGTSFNNNFTTGIHLSQIIGAVMSDNNITSNSGYLMATNTSAPSAAIFIDGSANLTISNNRIYGLDEWPLMGVSLNDCKPTINNPTRITNNFIGIGASYSALDFIGIKAEGTDFLEVRNNNLALEGNSLDAYCVSVELGSSSSIVNNNLVHFGSGGCLLIDNLGSVNISDFNNIFTNGSDLISFKGSTYNSLTSWKITGFDQHSVSTDPLYYDSPRDLHVCNFGLNGTGTYSSAYMFDLDGDLRNATSPDIGADEFTPVTEFSLGSDTGLCVGAALTLRGGNNTGDLNVWSTGDSSSTLTVSMAGTYTLSLFNECGAKQDTINVTMESPVSLPRDTNICAKETLNLNANISNATFNWNTGETASLISINRPGNYSVTVTDEYGCISQDTMSVTQSGLASILGDTVICGNQTAFLEANPTNATYSWSNGSTTNIITVGTPGVYVVDVNDRGCLSSDTIELSRRDLSNADYAAIVNGFTFKIISNNSTGGIHFWDFGDGSTSNLWRPTHVFPATSPGQSYTVTYRVSNECDTSYKDTTIWVEAVGVNEFELGNSISIYPNPSDGQFYIQLNDLKPNQTIEIVLTDLKGSNVASSTEVSSSSSDTFPINASSLSKGLYLVTIKSEDTVITKRIEIK